MSTYSERTLQLVQSSAAPAEESALMESDLAEEALRREQSYQKSRERNRRRATKRAGNLLQEAVSGKKVGQ